MAERPVFLPVSKGAQLVQEVRVSFVWHPGLAASQKRKNVNELHHAAMARGLGPLLEISSKSELEVGRRLSAFHLKLEFEGGATTVECAFQGSKVFQHGGPFPDLFLKSSKEAKTDPRIRGAGQLIGFLFEGRRFPISPMTLFYDWLYFRALYPHRDWLAERNEWNGFTDIEFNPERSINCQARSFAAFVSLMNRCGLDEAMVSFESFEARMKSAGI
ncbi:MULTISPECIES: DUF6977 family protein [unclassified Bradyrhizobium]|uniref:DarT1-associated NADAR antitoxin family protein n=1 Tax=unclassified Bradyrhizobium TaxID=2631580 RepID=UPI0029163ABC|nr:MULTISPECIES: hypothetical protein [unclassified Bradyrhizobium]